MHGYIIEKIGIYSDFYAQINLKKLCKYFDKIIKITKIDYRLMVKLDDNILKTYPDILYLNLVFNTKITDKGVASMSKLKELHLGKNSYISDKGIENLFNLVKLNLCYNRVIIDDGIKNLTNLKNLDMINVIGVTHDGIRSLLNLKNLIVDHDWLEPYIDKMQEIGKNNQLKIFIQI